MEQKYCEEESLQHWQLKSEANVKGLGGSSSVSVSLARKFEKPDLDGIKIWGKNFIMEFLFQTFSYLFLNII